jgi:ADP-dependent NAD(P)H-hydrate dehydratase / NAD(P)H-hydrate epimerase
VRAAHPEAVCTDTVDAAGRVQAWVAGSGLGTDDAAARAVRTVLDADVPVMLDADALTIVSRHPEWVADRSAPTVLTPHDREYARLAGEVGDDRIGAARRAADQLGAVVLLKGHHTVIAEPGGGTVRVVGSGVPELATAGTGDVLSGLLGSVLAAGVEPVEAAAAAAFAHGLAGRFAARRGPVSASRVLAALPDAVRVVLQG